MFGIAFRTFNDTIEMADKVLYGTLSAAQAALEKLTSKLGPSLRRRYTIVRIMPK